MVAAERRQKIAQRQARIDRLVMPHETAVGAEAARDRRPGDLKLDVIEPLDVALVGIADHDHAVVDADLRKRRRASRIGRQSVRQRGDQPGPVRLPAGQEFDGDGRPHQRHVGDFDTAGEQRKIAQPRRHLIGQHRRLAGAVVAEHDIAKAHGSGWKQRYRNLAAQHRFEPGYGVDFLGDRIAHRGRGNQKRQPDQCSERHRDQGGRGDRKTFKTASRRQGTRFRCC